MHIEEIMGWVSAFLIYGSFLSLIIVAWIYLHWWGILIFIIAIVAGFVIRWKIDGKVGQPLSGIL
jgi:hypothetical protein